MIYSGLMNSATRSRSSDNLGKYSPSNTRKACGDASPITHRLTDDGLAMQDNNEKNSHCSIEEASPSNTLGKGGKLLQLSCLCYCKSQVSLTCQCICDLI